MTTSELKEAFALLQMNSSVHNVGARVKLLRVPGQCELGWVRNKPEGIEYLLGQVGLVVDIDADFDTNWGVKVDFSQHPSYLWLPFFVLELAETPLMVGNHVVEVKDGKVVVNEMTITAEEIKAIHERLSGNE